MARRSAQEPPGESEEGRPKLEARDPEGTYTQVPREIEDPFRYGSRWVTDVLVCDDVKILWKDPALAWIAPDVAVIPGISGRRTG